MHAEAHEWMLGQLSQWQQAGESRLLQMVAGGIGCGLKSNIRDITSGLEIKQLVVGPQTGLISGSDKVRYDSPTWTHFTAT